MKKIIFALLGISCSLVCAAAGFNNLVNKGSNDKDRRVTRIVKIANFEKIALTGSYDIVYTQADKYSVEVTGPERLVKEVRFSLSQGTLNVRSNDKLFSGGKFRFFSGVFSSGRDNNVVIKISSPDLIAATVTGSGSFVAPQLVDTDHLELAVTGSGDMVFNNVICDSYVAKVTGSGDLEIKKIVAQRAELSLLGSGDLSVSQHGVKQTKASLRGSGDLDLNCYQCGEVAADLLGSGDISIEGTAKRVTRNVRGSGDISDHTKRP
ncbi:GIN domain-containing protein [Prevotella sp.]|uniref:GIN domain-containing protein n=1 Tax=Prevotella sp. TaxID=59823 RepID=UPI002F94D923